VAERLANGCSEREAFYFGAKKLGVNAWKKLVLKLYSDIAFNTGLD
jgi:hypothetical protein